MVGLSAIAISVAGIITIIIIVAIKAILHGAQATGKSAKPLYNLGKKFRIINSSFTSYNCSSYLIRC